VSPLVVAAVVVGIVALALAFVPIVNYGAWLLAVAGVVLGAVALIRRRRPRALALAGTVISGLAFVLSIVLALVYTAGLLSSVGGGGGGVAPAPAPTDQAPDAAAVESVPATFGQTVTYDDGMQIAVSEPLPFTPSAEAAGLEGDLALSFTVTIYNGTEADYELFPFTLVTADGQPGSVVVDEANSMPGVPPVATIAAGQTVTSIEGYSFPAAADASAAVVYQVAPGPEYLPSRFTQ
jgi:hypothetical protein